MPRNKLNIVIHPVDDKDFRNHVRAARKVPKAFEKVIDSESLKAAEKARKLAPVRTGKLRDGIEARVSGKGAKIVSEAPYSGLVEEGTRSIGARPFFRPAIQSMRKSIQRRMQLVFDKLTK